MEMKMDLKLMEITINLRMIDGFSLRKKRSDEI
jgi:hypothetical protein